MPGPAIAGSKSDYWKELFRKPEGSVTVLINDRIQGSTIGGTTEISIELLYQAFKARYDWEREHEPS